MLTAYFSGGRKHFRRPNFIISMPESVEQHHISGRSRAESDLLSHRPDFVIIEFSVNDESTEFFRETYEGLVRRVWQDENEPAVMLVHNVYYNNGGNAQIMHGQIARHYQLPAVSMQSSIYPEVVAGRIPNREITEDDLHPNDKGHELVASVITYAFG